MDTFRLTILCSLISISELYDVHAVMKPGPTALVKDGTSMSFSCYAMVRSDWRSTYFYIENLRNGIFLTGGLYNASIQCSSATNSPEYAHYCYNTIGLYQLYIRNVTAAYNNTRIRCRVQYSTDLPVSAETTVYISEHYRISSSSDVAYINGSLSVGLTCMSTNDNYYVKWKRNSVVISSLSYECRFIYVYLIYKYACDYENQRYYLTIPAEDITQTGIDGKWECESYYSNRTTSSPVTLTILDLPSLLITTSGECQTLNLIEFNCTLNTTYVGYYEIDSWVHSYRGKIIRELKGTQVGKSSILRIQFCNFQDIGDYTCVWKTDLPSFSIMKASTMLLVTGPPVILSHNVTYAGTRFDIYIMFFSLPMPRYPTWVFNGKSIEEGLKYTNSTIISDIPHVLQGVPVFIEGYITRLTIRNKTIYDEGVYTCILQNNIATTTQDIIINTVCIDKICASQSSEKIAGVAAGCIFATFIFTVIGHVLFRCFMARRTGIKEIVNKRNTNETYDDLGTRSLSGVYDLGIIRPSSVYENVENRGY